MDLEQTLRSRSGVTEIATIAQRLSNEAKTDHARRGYAQLAFAARQLAGVEASEPEYGPPVLEQFLAEKRQVRHACQGGGQRLEMARKIADWLAERGGKANARWVLDEIERAQKAGERFVKFTPPPPPVPQRLDDLLVILS